MSRSLKATLLMLLLTTYFVSGQVDPITITPSNPVPGDLITFNLQSEPNKDMNITISYNGALKVTNNEYLFALTSFEIPEKLENVTIQAQPVEFLSVTIIQNSIPITQTVTAKDGIAELSKSQISPGVHRVQLSGVTLAPVDYISVFVEVKSKITTDDLGAYVIEYDSTGFPPGDIVIQADTHTLYVLLAEAQVIGNIMVSQETAPEEFLAGVEHEIYYLITNTGSELRDLLIEYIVDDEVLYSDTIPSILANSSSVYLVTWTPSKSGDHNIQLHIDPQNVIEETIEEDNIIEYIASVEETVTSTENTSYQQYLGILIGLIVITIIIRWSRRARAQFRIPTKRAHLCALDYIKSVSPITKCILFGFDFFNWYHSSRFSTRLLKYR
jgi:hypothetical protein